MAIGKSGRLVIEINADAKKELHTKVKMKGMTLKEWFEEKVKEDFPELKTTLDKRTL
jgi:uncharacterized protein YacL (UPF0231 family)